MSAGSRRALAVLVAALVSVPLAGCGRRTAPKAPEVRVPAPVANLTTVVLADGIDLRWTNPTRRVDNTRMRDLTVARVFRAEDAGVGEPRPALLERGRVPGYVEVAAIRLASPAPAIVAGDAVTLVDRQGLTRDRRYTYVVVTADSLGRVSPPSSRASVLYIAAPEPPRDLVAEARESEVRLGWRPPARLVDGRAPGADLTYEVLRAAGADAPLEPVAGTPTAATAVVDRSVENDRTYHYAVRAIRTAGETRAIGQPTARAAATPLDLTPPSPPRNLVAIPSERTVRLSWSPHPEPDVAAYVVYRATGSGDFARVASVAPPATTFVDRDVPSGRYRYAVTAQDASRRGNESGRSNEVAISVP